MPDGIRQLAKSLAGKETDTRQVLQRFYEFVYFHEKPEFPTTGKPIEQLLEEYNNEGFFYGNCKEASTFYMALCNAVGYPTKWVEGKALDSGGHVWTDVFVPMKSGYKIFPVDAALGNFGNLDESDNLFFERSPKIPISYNLRFLGGLSKEYKLKIERID